MMTAVLESILKSSPRIKCLTDISFAFAVLDLQRRIALTDPDAGTAIGLHGSP